MSLHRLGVNWCALAMENYAKQLCLYDPGLYISAAKSVDSLPKEIIRRIIAFVPDPFDLEPASWMDNIHRLRGVCQLWRDIVFTSPTFFSKIVIHSKKRPECIQDWLNRSGTTDLTMYFALGCEGEDPLEDYVAMRDFTNLLTGCMHRCQKLFFHAHTAIGTRLLFRMLDIINAASVPVLHVTAEDDFSPHIPLMFASTTARVQHVVAESCALVLLPASLTALELRNLSPHFELTGAQVREALSAAPALQDLLVHEVSVFEVDGPRLTLPALTSLNFRCSSDSQADFISILDLPELRLLVLQVEDDDLFETITKYLNHGSKVARLSLSISSPSLHSMRSFFRTMPQLRWLRVTTSDEFLNNTVGALVLSSPDAFRSMQRMEFGDYVDEELLIGILRRLASSSSMEIMSRVSDVFKGRVKLQRLTMEGEDAAKKYQWVDNGDYWNDKEEHV
ncbi:hypothetical protein R3P38DRAFT_2785900 [Favolaschia claudopus]|uniref:F-box domain-containing protein n=1 Tax=Favolaschia claudopus TaxID=2862362 RepID=A0AAW0AS74_9AGAR